jgi:hypothetical protein
MKKLWFGAVLCCALFSLPAQEAGGFTLGAGFEGNMNTLSAAAGGASLSALFGLNRSLSLGVKGTASHNFNHIMTVEPELLFRWYAFSRGRTAFFVQAGLGSSLIFEDWVLYPVPLGGLAAGLRFSLGSLFIEPAVRGGYPFIWGAELTIGRRFGKPRPATPSPEAAGPAESPDDLLRR